MRRLLKESNSGKARLERLAAGIDALAEKDLELSRKVREVEAIRISAALALHQLCAAFVGEVNGLLRRSHVSLDPAEYSASSFRDSGANLFQIGWNGRFLEFEFETTSDLLSTEDFRVPYALSGSVRSFNQNMLDRNLMEEHLLFYTVEPDRKMWRYYDARTRHSGALDREYLVSRMEELL